MKATHTQNGDLGRYFALTAGVSLALIATLVLAYLLEGEVTDLVGLLVLIVVPIVAGLNIFGLVRAIRRKATGWTIVFGIVVVLVGLFVAFAVFEVWWWTTHPLNLNFTF